MPLSLLNHSALALFAQRTRIPTSARSIGFCAIWVCISSSSSSSSFPIQHKPGWLMARKFMDLGVLNGVSRIAFLFLCSLLGFNDLTPNHLDLDHLG